MLTPFNNKRSGQQLAFAALAILGILIIYSLSSLFGVALGAIIFYVLAKPIMQILTGRLKWNKTLAALTVILLSLVIIVGPIIGISNLFYGKVSLMLQDVSINETLKTVDFQIWDWFGVKILNEKNLQEVQQQVTAIFTNVLSESFGLLGNIGILFFILFYMLVNTGNIEILIEKHLPLSAENTEVLGRELEMQVYSNALGAPVLAILQGIVASLGFYFFNVPEFFFWGMMSGIFSLIPFVGSALVWLPAGIMALSKGNTFDGVGLILFGILVISTVDNLFRFVFQKRIADVHPLITILGIIGGVKIFGFSGLIFGPLMLSYFLILLRIYRERFV